MVKHYQTFLNTFEHFPMPIFQEEQATSTQQGRVQNVMQPTPSTAVITKSSAVRRTSTTPGKTPMKKVYKCSKCTHPPFQTKYSLAEHISVKHEAKGAQCDICLERMSSHYLAIHKDKHTITDMYHCKEKVPGTSKICTKSFKQKSGML